MAAEYLNLILNLCDNGRMAVDAIIVAGGRMPRALADVCSAPRKALLPVGGRTLLDTALTAAGECLLVDGCAVVGDKAVEAAVAGRAEFVPEKSNLADNVLAGFRALGEDAHDYVIISPDLPFLTAEALREFITYSRELGELCLPVVTRGDFLAQYSGAPNKFERLGGDRLTMGSCIYITGQALKANIPLARDFIRNRKFPHRLALLLGFGILLRFIFGQLRIGDLETRAEQLTGARCRAIRMEDASIAYDIDTRANYEFALKQLASGARE